MKSDFFRFLKFIFTARHTLGFGVHSPFIYHFLRFTVYVRENYYAFDKIENQRLKLALHNEIKPRRGKLLFRMIRRFNPENIVETGAQCGISTAYLAANSSKSRCITLCATPAETASEQLFKNLNLNNIKYCKNDNDFFEKIKKLDKIDFLFISGNIPVPKDLEKYIFPKITENTVIAIQNLNSKSGRRLWLDLQLQCRRMSNMPQITAGIDLFHFGILFFNSDLQRKEYRAIY